MITRRRFLQFSAAGVAAPIAGVGCSRAVPPAPSTTAASPIQHADRSLRLLILGGTGFIGPYQVEYALARGHTVTVFNRGSKSGLFGSRVEELQGDRDSRVGSGLTALMGDRKWDAVIDNSGYVPRHVRDSATLLQGRVGRYLFMSTVAAYGLAATESLDETGPLWPAPADSSDERVNADSYGPLKAECDRTVRAILGDAATVIRPQYIVGPGDTTDRFTYWVDRVARGGDVLGPPEADGELQFVDARDLCPWVVSLAEEDRSGMFNAAGPASTVSFREVLWGLAALTDERVVFHWPSRQSLEQSGIHLPLVGKSGNAVHFSNQASKEAGLHYRCLACTAKDTLTWWRSQSTERRAKAEGWPSPEQEAAVIAEFG